MTAEVKPFGEKVGREHAIVSMAFGIEFSSPIPPEALSRVASLHSSVKEELPGKKQKKSIKINVQSGPSAVSEQDLGVVIFESVNKDGSIARSLTVAHEHAFVNVNDYDSWAEAWAFAKKIFDAVFPAFETTTSVRAVTLEYLDKLYICCPIGEVDNSCVLKNDGEYLPSHIFNLRGPWHSNNGFFNAIESPFNTFVLNNINAALAEKKDVFEDGDIASEIELNLSHRALFNPTAINFSDLKSDSKFDHLMATLHKLHKTLFLSLISDDVSKIIGLSWEGKDV